MAQNHHRRSATISIIAVIALALIIFVIYKSAKTSLTHDESYSFLHYVPQSWFQIITFDTPFTNNHILGVDFPIQRFALFLFPILVWNVVIGMEILFKHLPKLVVFIGSVLVVLTVWNFARQVNTNYYRDWAYDADTRLAM